MASDTRVFDIVFPSSTSKDVKLSSARSRKSKVNFSTCFRQQERPQEEERGLEDSAPSFDDRPEWENSVIKSLDINCSDGGMQQAVLQLARSPARNYQPAPLLFRK